jgi:hypothetical protein
LFNAHAGAYQVLPEDEGENVAGAGSERMKAADEGDLKSGVATLQPEQ